MERKYYVYKKLSCGHIRMVRRDNHTQAWCIPCDKYVQPTTMSTRFREFQLRKVS